MVLYWVDSSAGLWVACWAGQWVYERVDQKVESLAGHWAETWADETAASRVELQENKKKKSSNRFKLT